MINVGDCELCLPFCRKDTGLGSRPRGLDSRRSRRRVNDRQCIDTDLGNRALGKQIAPCDRQIEGILQSKMAYVYVSSGEKAFVTRSVSHSFIF